MGVFLYSNRKLNTKKVEEVFLTRGHKEVVKHESADCTLISSNKIIIKNENFLSSDEITTLGGANSDFAIGIGTYFYKGHYGKEALKLVFQDLDKVIDDNPVYGQWAFCIHKNGCTYIFNDMSGFCRLYYYEKGNDIVVSSSMLSTISCVEDPKFDKLKLAGFLSAIYARETTFVEDVNLIKPLKLLEIKDGQKPTWVDRKVEDAKRIEDFDEAVEYVKGLFLQQINQIKPAIADETVYTNATGGLDSRLVASNLRANGIKIEFLNYPIYGPDSEIANILSKGINCKLHTQTNIPADDFEAHFGEYDLGHNFFRQYPNPRWILEHNFEFTGARGECIDLPDIYSDEELSFMKKPHLSALIDNLMVKPIMNSKIRKPYAEMFAKEIQKQIPVGANQSMTEQQQSEFCQILGGQWGDSMYNSAAQSVEYFYSIFNEWHFNHAVSNLAFFKVKGCRRLTLALISAIDKELGSFPFVSRNTTRRESVNDTHELPMQYSVYPRWIMKLMPIWLKNVLRGKVTTVKFTFDKSLLESIDFDMYRDVLNIKDLKKYTNVYNDIIYRMYSLEIIRKKLNITM